MKSAMIYPCVIIIIILFSCKKTSINSNTAEIRYEVTSTISDQYRVEYAENGSLRSENFTGTSWSKIVNLTLNKDPFNPNIARLTVFPPASWINTSPPATVGLKIYVKGILESKVDTVLKASDKSGIFTIVSF